MAIFHFLNCPYFVFDLFHEEFLKHLLWLFSTGQCCCADPPGDLLAYRRREGPEQHCSWFTEGCAEPAEPAGCWGRGGGEFAVQPAGGAVPHLLPAAPDVHCWPQHRQTRALPGLLCTALALFWFVTLGKSQVEWLGAAECSSEIITTYFSPSCIPQFVKLTLPPCFSAWCLGCGKKAAPKLCLFLIIKHLLCASALF